MYVHVVVVYYLLKNTMLNTKSTTKMATNEMTTDAVVYTLPDTFGVSSSF